MCSYTKLKSGEWGIRSASPISGVVAVTKKSGETKNEVVGNKVWSGNGVYLYAIARNDDDGYNPGQARHSDDEDRRYWHRGSNGKRYQCDRPGCNCGGYDDM